MDEAERNLSKGETATADKNPSPELVKDALGRIVNSKNFVEAGRARRFLEYVVSEKLAGRASQLKAYNIALEVFDRHEEFDPQSNPLVRVEAGKLRRLLELYYLTEGKDDPVQITIPKGGYGPLLTSRVAEEPKEAIPVERDSTDVAAVDVARWLGPVPRRVVVLLGMLTALAAGWLLFLQQQNEEVAFETLENAAPIERPVIFIAPFEDSTSSTSLAQVASGISRDVLHNLVQFGDIIVLDGGLVIARSDKSEIMENALELKADFILTGEVVRRDDRIRVSAQLSDNTGRIIWSAAEEEPLTVAEIFQIQDKISAKVAQTMAQPYGIVFRDRALSLDRKPPKSLSAYQCVVRAYEYRLQLSRSSHQEVRECLEETVAFEPDYIEATAMLSLIYTDEFRFAYNLRDELPERLAAAIRLAQDAVERSPENATAWRALFYAQFAAGETELALEAGQKALALNPNDMDVKAVVGFRMAVSGNWEEGLTILSDAISTAPFHPTGYYFAPVLDHYRKGSYDDALKVMKRIDMNEFFWTHAHFAMIYAQLGDSEKARAALDRTLELMPDFAKRAEDIVRMEIRDEDLIEKMIYGLRKAGLSN